MSGKKSHSRFYENSHELTNERLFYSLCLLLFCPRFQHAPRYHLPVPIRKGILHVQQTFCIRLCRGKHTFQARTRIEQAYTQDMSLSIDIQFLTEITRIYGQEQGAGCLGRGGVPGRMRWRGNRNPVNGRICLLVPVCIALDEQVVKVRIFVTLKGVDAGRGIAVVVWHAKFLNKRAHLAAQNGCWWC